MSIYDKTTARDKVNEFINTVRGRGDKADIGTIECGSWKTTHSKCSGCPSELGCNKVARLLILASADAMYKIQQPLPDLGAMRQSAVLVDRILNVQTMNELKGIPYINQLASKSEAIRAASLIAASDIVKLLTEEGRKKVA